MSPAVPSRSSGCVNVMHNELWCGNTDLALSDWCPPCLNQQLTTLSDAMTRLRLIHERQIARYDRSLDGTKEKQEALTSMRATSDQLRQIETSLGVVVDIMDERGLLD